MQAQTLHLCKKNKGRQRTDHECPEGGAEVYLYSFFNLGVGG